MSANVPAQSPSAVELQHLARTRLAEAQALLHAGLFNGCWYLGGYAVECALKAVICRKLEMDVYPDKLFRGALKSHALAELVQLAGLSGELGRLQQALDFDGYWGLVVTWNPEQRYQLVRTRQQAEDRIAALTDGQNGVFTWLSKQW